MRYLGMNELIKSISCDHYQDDIVLMDEVQMADNRRLIVDSINSLIQHDFTILILPCAGQMEIEIAGQQYECGRGKLLTAILSEGIVLKRMSDDFAARTICMSYKFVQGLDLDDTVSSGLAIRRQPLNDISEQTFHAVELIFDQLRGIIACDDNPYRYLALQLMVTTYNYTIGYYLRQGADTIRRTADEFLSDRFMKMAERDFIQHRDADYYADRLNVSKQHLSACVSRTTGSTVTEHLAHHVAIWAKNRLAHNNMSVEQIAAELNFANASHFGTYFKRTVGLSPATYRKSKRKGQ